MRYLKISNEGNTREVYIDLPEVTSIFQLIDVFGVSIGTAFKHKDGSVTYVKDTFPEIFEKGLKP